jgi:hypothetical protein
VTRRLFDDEPAPKSIWQIHAEECAQTAALFGGTAYPARPGWKGTDTSREAAATTPADTLRDRVLAVLADGPRSADAIADTLRVDILAIRPRVSELHQMGKVRDTGVRAINRSGKRAVVWGLVP